MIDIVVGPQAYHRLPELVGAGRARRRARSTPTCPQSPSSTPCRRGGVRARAPSSPSRKGATNSAPIASCPTPAAPRSAGRGRYHGRGRSQLVDAGAREIVLLGAERERLGRSRAAALPSSSARSRAIDGLERIRYTTSHPADMNDALIAAHGEVDKLMPYLHLPVQSGSDRILKAMNRSHSVESYLRIIEQVRAARPDIARQRRLHRRLPGRNRCRFRSDAEYRRRGRLRFGLFVQIQRPPGHSGGGDGGADRARGDGRAAAAAAGSDRQPTSIAFNQSTVGKDTQILIERKGRNAGQMIGTSPWLQSVHVETAARPGDMHRRDPDLGRSATAWPAPSSSGRPPDGPQARARRSRRQEHGRARLEVEFEQPYLIGPLFGDYDRHLITIENRARRAHRGARQQGPDRGRGRRAARARDVLIGLYNRLDQGEDVDGETVEAVLGMAAQPRLDGIIQEEVAIAAAGDDPHPQEDHRPALAGPDRLYGSAGPRRHDLRAWGRRAPARPISRSRRRCRS